MRDEIKALPKSAGAGGDGKPGFTRCGMPRFEAVAAMYRRAFRHLEETVNYPKWSEEHPSRAYIKSAIRRGEQFVYADGERILGAVVLSEDPEGRYELGDWKTDLSEGDYLVLHILAVDPAYLRHGIGGLLVDGSVSYAKAMGYKALRLDIVPENLPAAELYRSKGFTSAGVRRDLRDIEYIPEFELFELSIQERT